MGSYLLPSGGPPAFRLMAPTYDSATVATKCSRNLRERTPTYFNLDEHMFYTTEVACCRAHSLNKMCPFRTPYRQIQTDRSTETDGQTEGKKKKRHVHRIR